MGGGGLNPIFDGGGALRAPPCTKALIVYKPYIRSYIFLFDFLDLPIALHLKKTRALYLPPIIFGGHFKIAAQKFLCISARFSAKISISDSQIKTIFDSKIQSFDARRLIFWILGINEPIIHCVKNNRSQGAPSLKS